MVKQTRKIKQAEPFSKRIYDYGMPINLDKAVIREAVNGVRRQFFKEQYYFQIVAEGSETREMQRLKLKKLRRIIKDLNKVLKMQL